MMYDVVVYHSVFDIDMDKLLMELSNLFHFLLFLPPTYLLMYGQ